MAIYAMTGGATGIGAAIKESLRSDGHSVIVADIKDADIICDLSTADGRQAAIAGIASACNGALNGFIACAGVATHVPNKILIPAVNYYGTTELMDGVAGLLASNKGAAVLISSNSAPMSTDSEFVDLLLDSDENAALEHVENIDGQAAYSGSKQAVARWMRRNVSRFAQLGVRINAIAPGYTQTPMTQAVEESEEYGQAIRDFMASIPVGRPGQPEDMAKATSFLLSDAASFICGSVIFVDGGHDAMLRPDQF
ncbi:MAG: SDR family oxidoreductase [Pseudomonadales bacterium]